MPFVITQPCIDTTDQSCVEVCPVDCIHFESGADRMLYINPVECIDCGACQPACPVSAIFPEADVPEAQRPFTGINEQWYSDPAGARAAVQSLAGGSAPPAAAAPAAAAPSEGGEPSTAPAEGAPVAAAAAPAAPARTAPAVPVAQQTAATPIPVRSAVAPHLSPVALVAMAGFALVYFFMVVLPGPVLIELGDVGVGASVVLGLPLALIFFLLFLRQEWRAMMTFASKGRRRIAPWREVRADWRRSEEMRAYSLLQTVERIARDRYAYPTDGQPELRAFVNLPHPQLALEFAGGGGERLFPDILVVRHPGNYPEMVVQVETKETVTREQALYVWSRLENEQAPLDIYVPAGLAARAKDYARGAGLKHVRFRTWRWQPHGLTVREV